MQTDIEESPIDVLEVTVAQRYSVLVTARNDTDFNWAIHANMDTDMFDTLPDTLVYSTNFVFILVCVLLTSLLPRHYIKSGV